MEARNLRKERTGVVVSNKMDKTITVAAKFKEKHPIYGKFVSKTKKFHDKHLFEGTANRVGRHLLQTHTTLMVKNVTLLLLTDLR